MSASVSPGGAPDKHSAVRGMFDSIAPGYDRVNRLMTAGMDASWRRATSGAAQLRPEDTALDIGTGTGDLALELARSQPAAHVVGMDYSAGMLVRAPAKAAAAGLGDRVSWAAGDGQRLPFPEGSFAAVTSAFVLRNFADLPWAVSEMARVLAPGGRLVAMEASPGGSVLMRGLARIHFRWVVPALGWLFTGHGNAYRYLGDSIAAFLAPEEVARVFAAAGLETLPARRLAGGAILVHRALKPDVH
jgi:demethylmenaquinone methyltransferase/2-methoxy-6-polyprenyl-1,4-benzoquinol methylase